MATLFDELTTGNLALHNRIIMAPMTRSRADDAGMQPDFAVKYYAHLAAASRFGKIVISM